MSSAEQTLVCWSCGRSLDDVPLPISRRAYCPGCRVELHACRMCLAYDPRVVDQCREELDDVPHEKERANFCDLFAPRADAFQAVDDSKARAARAGLEALFGMPGEDPGQGGESEADAARRKLEELFGTNKDGS